MKLLSVHFSDFSADFKVETDHFYRLLSKRYKIVLNNKNPDFLLYSCYGSQFLDYDCVRIFYTAENLRPDFNLCDYAVGFDYLSFQDRYFRFPSFARYGAQFAELIRSKEVTKTERDTRNAFCNFIYSNAFADPARDKFFRRLCETKKVDSLGRHLRNVQTSIGDRYAHDWRISKLPLMQKYRFSICFENSLAPGYTTEKILHAFIAGTVPIYWGNPEVARDFNPRAFINCHAFDRFDDVIKEVLRLESDKDALLAMMNEPPFEGNKVPEWLSEDALTSFLDNIFLQTPPDARRRPHFGSTCSYEFKLKRDRQAELILSRALAPLRRIRSLFPNRPNLNPIDTP